MAVSIEYHRRCFYVDFSFCQRFLPLAIRSRLVSSVKSGGAGLLYSNIYAKIRPYNPLSSLGFCQSVKNGKTASATASAYSSCSPKVPEMRCVWMPGNAANASISPLDFGGACSAIIAIVGAGKG